MTVNNEIIDELETIVNSKKFTVKDAVKLNQLNIRLRSITEYLISNNKELPELGFAAYGYRSNPYSHTIIALENVLDSLKRAHINEERLYGLISYGLNGELNPSMFNVETVYHNAKVIQHIANTITEAHDNKMEIFSKVLRYEDSDFSKIEDGAFGFLDIDEMKEDIYYFEVWEMRHRIENVKKTDNENWPILKEIFPEEYL